MEGVHAAFPLVQVAAIIVIAVLAGLGLRHLKQPPLVGYILAGVILGPTGVGLIGDSEGVSALAEMGVLVLLFFIGTELSLKAFVATLRPALTVAAGQLVAAMMIAALIMLATGSTLAEGVVLGFILALSSTVVAMKMLDEMGALRRTPGRIAVGVLIAQDIAVVPMLILVSSLGEGGTLDPVQLVLKIAVAVGLLVMLLWWLGRTTKVKVPFDKQIGDDVELLALSALALCFGAAAISGVLGLSPAYGAFVVGLVIGNSTLRNRVIPVIEPIQSVLIVVFFLSIGLLIDLDFVWANLAMVAASAVLVIIAKTVLNVLLLRGAGFDRETALIGGLSMAQIGEFSFVLAAAGLAAGAMGSDIYRLSIAVTAITLLISPAWVSLMHRLEQFRLGDYASYRDALSTAYADEIGNVRKGLWWVRVRYRAWRAAQQARNAAQTELGDMPNLPPDSAPPQPPADDLPDDIVAETPGPPEPPKPPEVPAVPEPASNGPAAPEKKPARKRQAARKPSPGASGR